jgi:cytochrome c oxidase cbb3-type subunit 2
MKHEVIEKNSILLLVLSLLVVTVGGIVQIAPLYFLESTIEKVQGMRPYTPLEQAGRDVYIREGCYLCHSQMVRTLRDEVERYGHYSLAAESMYDHPFQWGSKRTGPDLARVGGKYSDKWHVEHMNNPRAVVPESVMPSYGWLSKTPLDYANVAANLKALKIAGVPYSDEMIAKAKADVEAQLKPDSKEAKELLARYPKAKVAKFDSGTDKITELDALVAYLQMLGTLVDFAKYDATGPNLR